MKRVLFYIIVLTSIIGFSQTPLVKAETDADSIRIGEQFIYKISVDETDKVILPKLNLNGLEVVDSLKTDTIKNSLIKKYIITGFDSGAYYIPKQQVFIKNRTYLTDSILIKVATVKVDTTKIKKFPIKAIKSESYQIDDFRHLWWIAVLVLLLLVFLLYWFVFRKKTQKSEQEQEPVLPPYDFALQALERLDAKLLWQNNKTKQYYSELTDILRVYIEDELDVPAMENTSDEIVKKLSRLHRKKEIIAPNATLNMLKNLLVASDLVKFAKSKPISTEIEQDRKNAEQILGNLKPKIVEENAE